MHTFPTRPMIPVEVEKLKKMGTILLSVSTVATVKTLFLERLSSSDDFYFEADNPSDTQKLIDDVIDSLEPSSPFYIDTGETTPGIVV